MPWFPSCSCTRNSSLSSQRVSPKIINYVIWFPCLKHFNSFPLHLNKIRTPYSGLQSVAYSVLCLSFYFISNCSSLIRLLAHWLSLCVMNILAHSCLSSFTLLSPLETLFLLNSATLFLFFIQIWVNPGLLSENLPGHTTHRATQSFSIISTYFESLRSI